MRTGNCSLQQGLTTDAANIVKQAITLAKRRGHAQVTPLHVANTMLSVTNGLLRTACLQSHSHPLQCKALELCFNVALNRLPATTSSPMLGSHHSQSQYPSFANALVAAFKRAQAHQRRGSIENQQQPLLTVKIELEQLIISILDDPSVSRVMREAGFNSTQVKTNVEQAVSLENTSSIKENNDQTLSSQSQEKVSNKALVLDPTRVEDINSVVESLKMNQRKSVVVVGECVSNLEGVVKGVMEKFEKGEVDESLKGVKFVSLSLCDFGNVSRVQVEEKVEELKKLATKSFHGKGYVLYLGDLKYLFDYKKQQGIRGYYSSIDHMIMEIGKLVNGVGENGKFWLMCIATFQAYMRCKNGQPSLETIWNLHPITIPAGTLKFSLITNSGIENESRNEKDETRTSWLLHEGVGDDQITQKQQETACFGEPSRKNETEVRSSLQRMSSFKSDSSSSSLPAWLQQYKNENKGITNNDQENCVQVGDLCKKWNNSMCGSTQTQTYHCDDKILTLSSASPSSSTSGFSYEQQQYPNVSQSDRDRSDHQFWISQIQSGSKFNEPSNPNSTSSSELMEMEQINKFKELNLENMKTLCNALEKKVPWQKDIIPEIASTVLQCRSGLTKRKGNLRNIYHDPKEETWLFFQGLDLEGKEKIAKELARLVFGSYNNFTSISLSSFASTRGESSEESRNKRSRDEASCSFIERFGDAMANNPHRVFLVEDIEQVDYCSQLGFKRAIEKGRVLDSNGEEVGFCDAIIILSCESFSSRSRVCSPIQRSSQEDKDDNDDDDVNVATLEETSSYVSLDLNISIDDNYEEDDRLVDEIGLLESVDRNILFKIQEL
ncbi:protein SMAX1-LIKE 3-like [Vicia villosa]|uniref:protein SMAX1-LIKE 3-like n=1 Tax=Vicia villosa TaxID=3911 RepID=UPI00273CB7FF|nr:protein SMAX1-LIKE 3-like [Vicia villosa]